jgi:hypothetical protein
MSERIQALKQQAADYVDSIDNGIGIEEYRELLDQKFAELIVKECADIALKSGNIANKNISAKIESERIYHKIMDHFGD